MKHLHLVTIAAIGYLFQQTLTASTVGYTYAGETGGGVSIGVQTAYYSGTVSVGQYIMNTAQTGYQSTLLTYSTDVGTTLNPNYNYTPTALSSATGVLPPWIAGGGQNAANLWAADKTFATTAIQTAGLQLAIWELLYNSPGTVFSSAQFFNSSNNGFILTSTDANTIASANYASSLIKGLANDPTATNVSWLAPTTSSGAIGPSAGLFYQGALPIVQAVPEGFSTIGLSALSIVAVSLAGKRLSRSQA